MTTTFDRFANRDDFLGFGYIGSRQSFTAEEVAPVDAAILDIAEGLGWDEERLFEWANSKDGRWFADTALGCGELDNAIGWYL
jgi:hypothetical protein